MSDCTFCGDPAGLFKHEHQDCAEKHASAIVEIRELSKRTAMNCGAIDTFRSEMENLATHGYVADGEEEAAIAEGFTLAVNAALEDNLLSEEEDEALGTFLKQCGLSQDKFDFAALMRVTMAGALRDVMEGKVPKRIHLDGDLPFNLDASEQLVWVWGQVEYGEERTHRTRVGGYGGPSFRIASGMYWRMGGFASQNIEQTSLDIVDKGTLAATTEHLYFKGQHKALKIPFGKIVSWDQYADGLGICQGDKSSRPQVFKTGEGWFIYNLVRNLAQTAAEPEPPRPRTPERSNVVGFAK